MSNTLPPTVWVIHYAFHDGSGAHIVDRAFASEDEARWQIKLLVDLADGRKFSLHRLPVL